MSYCNRRSIEETLAILEKEFEEADHDYEGPRLDDEACIDLDESDESFSITVSTSVAEKRRIDNDTHKDLTNAEGLDFSLENSHSVSTQPNTVTQEPRSHSTLPEEEFSADTSVVEVKHSFEDKQEDSVIDDFMSKTCGCQLGNLKSSCSMVISRTTIMQMRNNCHQMSAKELDLVIMAQLNALRTHVDDKPSTFAGHSEFRPTTKYFVHGMPICQKMFCFLHTVGKFRLESLSTWVTRNGVTERSHGNTKRLPHNASSREHVKFLTEFIKNIANTHGLPLPGRLPNHEQKVFLLPSDMSKDISS